MLFNCKINTCKYCNQNANVINLSHLKNYGKIKNLNFDLERFENLFVFNS